MLQFSLQIRNTTISEIQIKELKHWTVFSFILGCTGAILQLSGVVVWFIYACVSSLVSPLAVTAGPSQRIASNSIYIYNSYNHTRATQLNFTTYNKLNAFFCPSVCVLSLFLYLGMFPAQATHGHLGITSLLL